MNITVFLGAPGSGKGTQAKRLAQAYNFRHFSTGDMLRAAMKEASEVGKKAKAFVDRGELVPDAIMIELIESALSTLPSNARVILDGFPRTVPQALALDQKSNTAVAKALYFMVPETTLVNRLTGRRVCESCGEPFHVLYMPPRQEGTCDKCGGKLIHRTDDSEAVVRRRLEIFTGQNSQLLTYYGQHKKLHELDGDRPVETLQKDLIRILD